MKIDFERSGGFTGIRLTASLDTKSMSAKEGLRLEKLVEKARFFELPEKPSKLTQGADQFFYNVTVEIAGKRHTVQTDEMAAPEALRPLLRHLAIRTRSLRRR